MQRRANFLLTSGLVMLLVAATWGWARAGEPTEAIRDAVNRGVDVLKDGKVRDARDRAQLVERLRPIVYPMFDFREMAMRSLGAHWRQINPEQQQEFVAVFTKLLEKTYASQIDLYNGQQVIYTGETNDGDFATVESQLIAKDKRQYSVVYRLHKLDGNWRIYDVVAENLSIVNNYREQFNRAILKTSFTELLDTMKQKAS